MLEIWDLMKSVFSLILSLRRWSVWFRAKHGKLEGECQPSQPASLTIVWVCVIPDSPQCAGTEVVVVAVSETSRTNLIPCDTKGLPQATSYRWALNTSAGVSQISRQNSSSLNITRDQLSFSQHRKQIGEVRCWASNSLGESKHPCVFHLVTAGQWETWILDGKLILNLNIKVLDHY